MLRLGSWRVVASFVVYRCVWLFLCCWARVVFCGLLTCFWGSCQLVDVGDASSGDGDAV